MTRILLVEPDHDRRGHLRANLQRNGFQVDETQGVRSMRDIDVANIAVIIANTQLSDGDDTATQLSDGDDTAAEHRNADVIARAGGIPVILLAENASIRTAVTAIKQGAADFIARPFDPDELIAALERVVGTNQPTLHLAALNDDAWPMFGQCPAMLELFERIRKVAPTGSSVLIQGESGTGKELVARALHSASNRRHAPMITLNCAAIPETLIESELFGHERGAFSGAVATSSGLVEAAHAGTLFLDEIGEIPLEAQARLLRVLQDGETRRVGATRTRPVDVRLISATHRDLRQLTANNQFREDLFYRLNVVTLTVPNLRDRGDDVVELARWMLTKTAAKLSKPDVRLSKAAIRTIREYPWPGNVRELQNAVERAVILCDDDEIEPALLAIDMTQIEPLIETDAAGSESLEDYFVRFVIDNQDQCTETELAQKLGISRKSLWERRQRLNVPRRKTRKRGPRRNG
ncbi:MAG: sigma-54 dependent transcriptional regulator [Gammaproteobacteria bacterium]|nr:sigma-54 dependent transcriptional regulator [Gammaproteobacteria bacterium]